MEIFTLNVGQGEFVVVTGETEAIIIDTFIPLTSQQPTEFVKGALTKILSGKNLMGLIVTSFDADHFNEVGMSLVLNKYNPAWIIYPQYFKNTETADKCFKIISSKKGLERVSVNIATNPDRNYILGNEFKLELFSPHSAGMNSSNNSSLVGKLTETSINASYLITGDTENERWVEIGNEFSPSLKSDVLSAPHHGSDKGITYAVMSYIRPHTVLISAGIGNQWGHPEQGAMTNFKSFSSEQYSTNWGEGGQTLQTSISGNVLYRNVKTVKRTF